MYNWLKILLMLHLLLGNICFAQSTTPPDAASSEWFTTSGAGFAGQLDSKTGPQIHVVVSFDIKKSFGRDVFAEVSFQNPDSPAELKAAKTIASTESTFTLKSPEMNLPQPSQDYKVVLRVYADETRQVQLAEHVQYVQAPSSSQSDQMAELLSRGTRTPKFWAMDLGSERWIVGNSRKTTANELVEHVREGETVQNCTELLSEINFYSKTAKADPITMAYRYISTMKANFPSFESKILQQSSDQVVLEWWQSEQAGDGPEHAFFLVRLHSSGFHVLQFSRKGQLMNHEYRTMWLDRFLSARLMYLTK